MIKNYKTLILLGVMLWVVGCFLAGIIIYPYALIGIYSGPPLLFLGAIGWTINYRRTNGRFPNPIKTLKTIRRENPGFAGYQARMEYLLNHLLEFWTICVLLWVFLSFAGTGAIKDFVAFKIMANYVEHDSTLREKVGEVKYYGFWLTGGVSSNGEGDISFTIIGQNGTARARAVVSNVDGQSKVTTMTYK